MLLHENYFLFLVRNKSSFNNVKSNFITELRSKLLIANIKSLSCGNKVSRLHVLIKEISTSKNRWQLCDPTGIIYLTKSNFAKWIFLADSVIPEEYLRISIDDQTRSNGVIYRDHCGADLEVSKADKFGVDQQILDSLLWSNPFTTYVDF